MLLDDGFLSIVGTVWEVGHRPTGKNSVRMKGGLWRNEIGMEDTISELEWLSINETNWKGDEFLYIRRDPIWGVMYHKDYNNSFNWYTRKEWQKTRYYRGLDQKPRCRLVKGEWVKQ
jgi:hypothetical protein